MTNEKFHWTAPSGAEIVLPHMNKIKGGLLRKYRKLDPVDFMFSVLEDIADEETLAQVDDLENDDMNAMFEAWQKAGADLGKSSGSST